MASNAKFCSQCASPLPEPNPPFCSQCGTAVTSRPIQTPPPPQTVSPSSDPVSIPTNKPSRTRSNRNYALPDGGGLRGSWGSMSIGQKLIIPASILGSIIGLLIFWSLYGGLGSGIEQNSKPESPACLEAKRMRDSLPQGTLEYAPMAYMEAEKYVRMRCDN